MSRKNIPVSGDRPRPTAAERAPLSDSRFRRFATGNVINNVGETAFVGVAPLLLVQIYGPSAAALSVIATALSGVLSPVVGAAIDARGWRPFFYAGLAVQSLSIGAVTAALVAGRPPLAALGVLLVVNAVASLGYLSAWKVGLNELFPDFRRRARGSLNTLFYMTGIVGPLTAFVILSTNGVTLFLIFYVITSSAPVVALLQIDRGRPRAASRTDGTAMRALSAGLTYIRGSVVLRRLLVLRCLASALPPTLIGALIVLEFESYAAAPLLILAVSNAMVYLGNQYVSRMADFREVEIVLVYGTMSLAGIALLNVDSMYAFVAGVAVFGIATGVGLSHFVLATVVYSPPEIYGSISGVFGLASSVLGLTVGVLLSQGGRDRARGVLPDPHSAGGGNFRCGGALCAHRRRCQRRDCMSTAPPMIDGHQPDAARPIATVGRTSHHDPAIACGSFPAVSLPVTFRARRRACRVRAVRFVRRTTGAGVS